MAEISEHPLLTGVPAEPTFIKHELVKKLELYSLAFNKSDITVRQDRLKIDRKNPKQTLVKDDLALLDNEINEELILENIILSNRKTLITRLLITRRNAAEEG